MDTSNPPQPAEGVAFNQAAAMMPTAQYESEKPKINTEILQEVYDFLHTLMDVQQQTIESDLKAPVAFRIHGLTFALKPLFAWELTAERWVSLIDTATENVMTRSMQNAVDAGFIIHAAAVELEILLAKEETGKQKGFELLNKLKDLEKDVNDMVDVQWAWDFHNAQLSIASSQVSGD